MEVDTPDGTWNLHGRPEPGKPHAVFLHGFTGTGADWLPHVGALPEGWAWVAPDLPGHGRTRLQSAMGFDTWPTIFGNFLRALQITDVVAIGYSFGARLLLPVLTSKKSGVRSAILESVNPGLADGPEKTARRKRDLEDIRTLETKGLDAFLRTWHQNPVFAERRKAPDWADEVERKRATNDARRLAEALRTMSSGAQPDFTAALGRVKTPLLLLAGELDAPYAERARTLHAQRPDTRSLVLAPCGHNVHTEQPLVFRDALREHLSRTRRR